MILWPSDLYNGISYIGTGSDNGLSPDWHQAIIRTHDGILLIWLQWNINRILIFSFKKMHLKMTSAKWCPFCISLSVLNNSGAQAWMFQENNVKTCDALVHCFTMLICFDDIQNVGQTVLYLTLIMLIPLSTTCTLLVSKNNRKCQHNFEFPQTNSAHTRLPVPGNHLSQSPLYTLVGSPL